MSEDNSYHLTAHVDLLNTVLQDFIEHMDTIVQVLASMGLQDKGSGQWKEIESDKASHLPENTKISQWQLLSPIGETLIGLSVVQRGDTTCKWFAFFPQQGQGYSTWRKGTGKSDFSLEATHYRRDRLNVVMWESPNVEPILGKYLLTWMKQYWREGVDDLLAKGIQTPVQPTGQHPTTWVDKLHQLGVEKGTTEWWKLIEQWTREYWQRNGRSSLPISPVLENITGYSRSQIYAKTNLGENSGQ